MDVCEPAVREQSRVRITQELQRRRNESTRHNWAFYRTHRTKVTRLALGSVRHRRGARLCVLGAGNCNDLDLRELLRFGLEVHLVDIDGQATTLGVARQGLSGHASLHLHPGLDLAADGPLERLTALAKGSFDSVLSTCLLTQLLQPRIRALGNDNPKLPQVLREIRKGHLLQMLDLLAPSGSATLITDLVDSQHCPDLGNAADGDLQQVITQVIEAGDFFSGVNPLAIRNSLEADPQLSHRVREATMTQPWLWRMSADRLFLAYALVLQPHSSLPPLSPLAFPPDGSPGRMRRNA